MMQKCAKCNTDNLSSAEECKKCGAILQLNKKAENDVSSEDVRKDEQGSSPSNVETIIDDKLTKGKKSEDGTVEKIISNRYRMIEKIGEGGMGIVWKAHDKKLDRVVALKQLSIKLSSSLLSYHRFIREAKVLSKMNHPNICGIYDLIEDGDVTYIVMEYYDGAPLSKVISEKSASKEEKINIAEEIAGGLAAAHERGIVHRDLKPSNILTHNVKILDFGLAKQSLDREMETGLSIKDHGISFQNEIETVAFENESDSAKAPSSENKGEESGKTPFSVEELSPSEDLTTHGSVIGTYMYMSPEQTAGEELGPASDIFSLGIILYELFTGDHPFSGKRNELLYKIRSVEYKPLTKRKRSFCPGALTRLIDRALSKERHKRPSAMDFARVIARVKKRSLSKILSFAAVVVPLLLLSAFILSKTVFKFSVPEVYQLTVLEAANETNDEKLDWIRTALSSTVRTTLQESTRISATSGKEVASLAKQLKMSPDVDLKPDSIKRRCAFLSSSHLCSIIVSKREDTYEVDVKVYHRNGEIAGNERFTNIKKLDMFELSGNVSEAVFSILEIKEDAIKLDAIYSKNENVNRKYFKGVELLQSMQPIAAREYLLDAVTDDRSFALAYLRLAEAWAGSDYDNRKIENYVKAILNQERLPLQERIKARAALAMSTGFPDLALKIMKSLKQNNPGDFNLELEYVKNLINASGAKDAIEILKRLEEEEPDNVSIANSYAYYYSNMGGYEQAEKYFAKARELALKRGNRESAAQATTQLANIKKHLGKYDEAEKMFLRNIKETKEIGAAREEGWSNAHLALLYFQRGNIESAKKHTLEAHDIFKFTGNMAGVGETLSNLGFFAYQSGDINRAEKLFNESLRIWNDTGYKMGQGGILYYLAFIEFGKGNYHKAAEIFPESIEIAHELGNKQHLTVMYGGLGSTYLYLGKLDLAEKMYNKQMAYCLETKRANDLLIAHDNQTLLSITREDYETARKENAEAMKLATDAKDTGGIAIEHCMAGLIEFYAGEDYKKAKEELASSIKGIEKMQNYSWLSLARVGLAAASGLTGDDSPGDAMRKINEGIKLCRKKGRANFLIEEYWIKGEYARITNQDDIALNTYRTGLKLAKKYSMNYFASQFQKRLNRK